MRFCRSILAALLAVPCILSAAEPPALKIAIADLGELTNKYQRAQRAMEALRKEIEADDKEAKKKATQIQGLQKEHQAVITQLRKGVIVPSRRRELEAEAMRIAKRGQEAEREFTMLRAKQAEEFARRRQKLGAELGKEVLAAVKKIAEQEGFTLVLDRSARLPVTPFRSEPYHSPAVPNVGQLPDITLDVLKELNRPKR